MVSLYKVHVLNILIINIIMATSLNLIMGYAGQFAKANVAFMGLGAYTMGVLVTRADWSFWIAWPTGALLAAGVGTPRRPPRAPPQGPLYLAIITISFVLIVHWSFLHARFITGGANRLLRPPTRTTSGCPSRTLSRPTTSPC